MCYFLKNPKEFDEKHVSLGKTITEINIQIKNQCSELAIPGLDISTELKSLPKQITKTFDEITANCSHLTKAVNFYTDYIEHFFQRKSAESLPILVHFIHRGNTTVYEWRTGEAPLQVERPPDAVYTFGDEQHEEAADEIDFGIDVADFGLSVGDQNDADGDIDWGDFDANTDNVAYDIDLNTDTADFDMDALKSEISVEGTGVYVPEDNIAKGEDALDLLDWSETRNLLLNDLFKLEAFLRQKASEMKSESDNVLLTTILQDAPKSLQLVTEKGIFFNFQFSDAAGFF